MGEFHVLDIHQRVSRNRLRLALALVATGVLMMIFSNASLYLFFRAARINTSFWIILTAFWLGFLIYTILRYALGGQWMLQRLVSLPPSETDNRLRNALDSAKLASGISKRIRVMEIPDSDINSFSFSLPDGSFMLFATKGIAEKLPECEREAIMAHEIAHMQMGDTLLHTLMIRLAGQRAARKIVTGGRVNSIPFRVGIVTAFISACLFIGLYFAAGVQTYGPNFQYPSRYAWMAVAVVFLATVAILPLIWYKILQWSLDKQREYYADMQAVYLTRDPEAVYAAIKDAAEDVIDVLLLPAYFDALLFCPVVDYQNYRPFRSQPTMAARLERLREAFPQIGI